MSCIVVSIIKDNAMYPKQLAVIHDSSAVRPSLGQARHDSLAGVYETRRLILSTTGGIVPKELKSDQVLLSCRECKKELVVPRDDTDPPNCARLETLCPDCDKGDFESIDYWDTEGRQINCLGEPITPANG